MWLGMGLLSSVAGDVKRGAWRHAREFQYKNQVTSCRTHTHAAILLSPPSPAPGREPGSGGTGGSSLAGG